VQKRKKLKSENNTRNKGEKMKIMQNKSDKSEKITISKTRIKNFLRRIVNLYNYCISFLFFWKMSFDLSFVSGIAI